MKLPLLLLIILAIAGWTSAVVLLVLGSSSENLSVLKWAAIPDFLMAVVVTVGAVRKWAVK